MLWHSLSVPNPIAFAVGSVLLKATGWKLVTAGSMPRSFVAIAAPHTSNWDFPYTLATAWCLRTEFKYLGKHTLFTGPFGWFFKAMGGIPVDRRAPQGLVSQVVQQFRDNPSLIVAVPPEGTRGRVSYWKSGFYHIAHGANVPIGLGYLDFGRRQCGIGGFIQPTGDLHADMDKIRAFYKDIRGKRPDRESPVCLREEDTRDVQPGAAP